MTHPAVAPTCAAPQHNTSHSFTQSHTHRHIPTNTAPPRARVKTPTQTQRLQFYCVKRQPTNSPTMHLRLRLAVLLQCVVFLWYASEVAGGPWAAGAAGGGGRPALRHQRSSDGGDVSAHAKMDFLRTLEKTLEDTVSAEPLFLILIHFSLCCFAGCNVNVNTNNASVSCDVMRCATHPCCVSVRSSRIQLSKRLHTEIQFLRVLWHKLGGIKIYHDAQCDAGCLPQIIAGSRFLTPNSHQAHLRIRTPRSLHTKNRYHACECQSKWAVSSCVHTECMCATMIADGFQPQTCTGTWCGMS